MVLSGENATPRTVTSLDRSTRKVDRGTTHGAREIARREGVAADHFKRSPRVR